jgi:hypothetical protein
MQSYALDGAIYKLSGAVAKLESINLRKLVLSPTGSINPCFILREDLLMCSSYLPLGVPNWAVIYTTSCCPVPMGLLDLAVLCTDTFVLPQALLLVSLPLWYDIALLVD